MAERVMRMALESALSAVTMSDADRATVALARRYADDIDESETVSVQAAKWLRSVESTMNPVTYDQAHALLARIEHTTVLATIGPKLLAVLTELGMSPRSRADVVRRGGAVNDPPKGNPLAEYRAERARRIGNA